MALKPVLEERPLTTWRLYEDENGRLLVSFLAGGIGQYELNAWLDVAEVEEFRIANEPSRYRFVEALVRELRADSKRYLDRFVNWPSGD